MDMIQTAKQNEQITAALNRIISNRHKRAEEKSKTWNRLKAKQTELEKLKEIHQKFLQLDKNEQEKICGRYECEFLTKSAERIIEYSSVYQNAIQKLKALEERFNRKTVNLVVIGKIGAGKSRFLQSVSGLDDDCIPSFEGPSCTGITSVIENVQTDGVEAVFTFKTSAEVLQDLKHDIANLVKKTDPDYVIPDITEFEQADAILHKLAAKHSEAKKLIEIYTANRQEWLPYLDASLNEKTFPNENLTAVKTPNGTWEYTLCNKPEIKKFVSKHNGKKAEDGRIYYYRFVAVKNALIRTKFPRITAKIRLIDTVGIGDQAADTEKRMQTAMNDDADGIIFVLSARNRRTDSLMDEENTALMQKFQTIYDHHKTEHAAYWMSLLVNHEGTGDEYLKTVVKPAFGGADKILGPDGICPENQRAVNAAAPSEVLEMLIDFLNQISRNLNRIDQKMEDEANKLQQEAESSDAELRSELSKIRIQQNGTEEGNYIAGLAQNRVTELKDSLEKYAEDIRQSQNHKQSFLEESLNLIQDMIEEKPSRNNQTSLKEIIENCKKLWSGFDKQRAAVFLALQDAIRRIGSRTPSGQELETKMFKKDIADRITENFKLRLTKMDSRTLKPFTASSPDFFDQIADLLIEGQYNAEDICSAFHSISQFRLDTYNGITKALFNHFAAEYIKDEPYDEPVVSHAQPASPVSGIYPPNGSLIDLLTQPAPVQPVRDKETLLLEELKTKLRMFKDAIQKQTEHEKYLVSENDQKYEELTHFIQILSKEYYSPWERVFEKLIKKQWIEESKLDKERQRIVFEIARDLEVLIKNAR